MKKLSILYGYQAIVAFLLTSLGLFHKEEPLYMGFLIMLISLEYLLILYSSCPRKEKMNMLIIFTAGLLVRLVYMYYDISHPAAESIDCRDFRLSAELFFDTNRASFRGSDFSFTTLFMGLVLKVFGKQRAMLPFWNTIAFMAAAFIAYLLLTRLRVPHTLKVILITWMLFTPQNIKNSAMSNREGFCSFLIALSLYYFISYTEKPRAQTIVKSLLPVAVGAMLHSGVMGIASGYIFYYSLYDKKNKRYRINRKTVIRIVLIVLLIALALTAFGDLLFAKFGTIETASDISRFAGSGAGNSGYAVGGLNANSLGSLLFYTPVRSIYFLLSPMPWDWRDVIDMIAFLACSVPQILLMWRALSLLRIRPGEKKAIVIALLVSYVCIAVIFGWGVMNAGTAIRHRDKFLSLQVVLLGMLFTGAKLRLTARRPKRMQYGRDVPEGGTAAIRNQ